MVVLRRGRVPDDQQRVFGAAASLAGAGGATSDPRRVDRTTGVRVYSIALGALAVLFWGRPSPGFANTATLQELWVKQTWSAERIVLPRSSGAPGLPIAGGGDTPGIAGGSAQRVVFQPLGIARSGAGVRLPGRGSRLGCWSPPSWPHSASPVTSARYRPAPRWPRAVVTHDTRGVGRERRGGTCVGIRTALGIRAGVRRGNGGYRGANSASGRTDGPRFPAAHDMADPSCASDLLAVAGGVVVFLSAQVAETGLTGRRAIRDHWRNPCSPQWGRSRPTCVPLASWCWGWPALRPVERSTGYAFVGGLVFVATLAAGYALGVITAGGALDGSVQLLIWLLASGGAASRAAAWLAAQRRHRRRAAVDVCRRALAWGYSRGVRAMGAPHRRVPRGWAARPVGRLAQFGWLVLAVSATGATVWHALRNAPAWRFHALRNLGSDPRRDRRLCRASVGPGRAMAVVPLAHRHRVAVGIGLVIPRHAEQVNPHCGSMASRLHSP